MQTMMTERNAVRGNRLSISFSYGSPLQTTLDQSEHYASLHEMYHDWDCFAAYGWGFEHIQPCDAKGVLAFLPLGPSLDGDTAKDELDRNITRCDSTWCNGCYDCYGLYECVFG